MNLFVAIKSYISSMLVGVLFISMIGEPVYAMQHSKKAHKISENIKKERETNMKNDILKLVLIGIAGIFGAIATLCLIQYAHKAKNSQPSLQADASADGDDTDYRPLELDDALRASMIAGAVGDAMGRVTEFVKSTDEIFKRYPHGIRTFDDFVERDWMNIPSQLSQKKIAPYTDDTAMAKIVLEVLIDAKKHMLDMHKTMDKMAKAFAQDMCMPNGWAAGYRAPGNTCMKYCRILKNKIEQQQTSNKTWWAVSPVDNTTGGCGSVMHAHPFGLIFYDNPQKAAAWAAQHSVLTHGSTIAQAASAAMAIGVAYNVQHKDPQFVLQKMIEVAQKYDKGTAQKMRKAINYAQQAQPLLARYKYDVVKALTDKNSAYKKLHDKVFNEFQGWAAHDAIAATAYIFDLFPNDVMKAIYLGVHTPGDSDSIASMAGALVGARVGMQQLPPNIVDYVEGSAQLQTLARQAAALQ